jgi:hypothetical protein
MFWAAILPALLTLWIRARVPESPVWLERQRHIQQAQREGRSLNEPKISILEIFKPKLLGRPSKQPLSSGRSCASITR